jgi:hypothetical protein
MELANARQTLGEALAIYNNQNLLSETCTAGKLRRLECAWAIEQTIILTYQLQNELLAVSDRLVYLQDKIRNDCHQIIDNCHSQIELDFIFPEITCICDRDLIVLEAWQNQVDYFHTLPASELEYLELPESNDTPIDRHDELLTTKPIELTQYEEVKSNSHYHSLVDQLKFKVSPNLRQKYQNQIGDRATASGHKVLTKNIEIADDMTVANLYWYFQTRE